MTINKWVFVLAIQITDLQYKLCTVNLWAAWCRSDQLEHLNLVRAKLYFDNFSVHTVDLLCVNVFYWPRMTELKSFWLWRGMFVCRSAKYAPWLWHSLIPWAPECQALSRCLSETYAHIHKCIHKERITGKHIHVDYTQTQVVTHTSSCCTPQDTWDTVSQIKVLPGLFQQQEKTATWGFSSCYMTQCPKNALCSNHIVHGHLVHTYTYKPFHWLKKIPVTSIVSMVVLCCVWPPARWSSAGWSGAGDR